mgnify:CR=1 FL=1
MSDFVWGKDHSAEGPECLEETMRNLDVPDYVPIKGRGPPPKTLKPRRIRTLGGILYEIGIPITGIYDTEADTFDPTGEETAHWTDRISKQILHGGIEENRTSISSEFSDFFEGGGGPPKKTRLRFSNKDKLMLIEHMERTPLAYGMKGMNATLIRFTRDPKACSVDTDRFYAVHLQKDEPSPVVFDEREMKYLYARGFGLCPLFEVKRETPRRKLFGVCGKTIFSISEIASAGQLEPAKSAPMPSKVDHLLNQIHTRPGHVSTGDAAYLRSTLDYCKEIEPWLGASISTYPPLLLLEAYGVCSHLIKWSLETSDLLGTPPTEDQLEMQKALLFVLREIEHSPWNLSESFRFLFREVGGTTDPYPLGSFMQVENHWDPRLVNYLPTRIADYVEYPTTMERFRHLDGGIDVDDDDSPIPEMRIGLLRHTSTKRKRSSWNENKREQITGTERDIRTLKMDELKDIIRRLGVKSEIIDTKIKNRWDRTWVIQKAATIPGILNGEIKNYVRAEQKSQKHNADIAPLEQLLVQRRIEKQDFFREFRRRAALRWRLATCAPGSELDMMVHRMQTRNESEDTRFASERENRKNAGNEDAAIRVLKRRVNSDWENRQKLRTWKSKLDPMHGAVPIRKRVSFGYMEEGTVCRKRERISVTYFPYEKVYPEAATTTTTTVIEQCEEEEIIEEEE